MEPNFFFRFFLAFVEVFDFVACLDDIFFVAVGFVHFLLGDVAELESDLGDLAHVRA